MIASKICSILIVAWLVTSVMSAKHFNIDGVRYLYSDSVWKNWYQAIRYCRQKGMYLLDFESDEEYIKMKQYLRDHIADIPRIQLWLAGTSLGTIGGEFYWITSGADVNTEGFYPGQPDNGFEGEYCLEFDHGWNLQWNDDSCEREFPFICRATKYFKLIPKTN